jgi:hypothetical protein
MFACYQAGYDRQDLALFLGDNVCLTDWESTMPALG